MKKEKKKYFHLQHENTENFIKEKHLSKTASSQTEVALLSLPSKLWLWAAPDTAHLTGRPSAGGIGMKRNAMVSGTSRKCGERVRAS